MILAILLIIFLIQVLLAVFWGTIIYYHFKRLHLVTDPCMEKRIYVIYFSGSGFFLAVNLIILGIILL